jgi:hypothetical protein
MLDTDGGIGLRQMQRLPALMRFAHEEGEGPRPVCDLPLLRHGAAKQMRSKMFCELMDDA